MGICGAIIGTITALVYRGIVTIHYSNRKILKRSQFCTYKILLVNSVIFTGIMAIFYVDTFSNYSFLSLLLNGVLNAVWITGLYLVANFVFNKSAFKTVLEFYREKKNQ